MKTIVRAIPDIIYMNCERQSLKMNTVALGDTVMWRNDVFSIVSSPLAGSHIIVKSLFSRSNYPVSTIRPLILDTHETLNCSGRLTGNTANYPSWQSASVQCSAAPLTCSVSFQLLYKLSLFFNKARTNTTLRWRLVRASHTITLSDWIMEYSFLSSIQCSLCTTNWAHKFTYRFTSMYSDSLIEGLITKSTNTHDWAKAEPFDRDFPTLIENWYSEHDPTTRTFSIFTKPPQTQRQNLGTALESKSRSIIR